MSIRLLFILPFFLRITSSLRWPTGSVACWISLLTLGGSLLPVSRIYAQEFKLQSAGFISDVPLTEGPAPLTQPLNRAFPSVRDYAAFVVRSPKNAPRTNKPGIRVRLSAVTPGQVGDTLAVRVSANHRSFGVAEGTVVTSTADTATILYFDKSALQWLSVGAANVNLRWEYKRKQGIWQPLGTSQHRVYFVLDRPASPWFSLVDNKRVYTLRPEVLEVSCRIAKGTRTAEDAAAAITRFMYQCRPVDVDPDVCEGKFLYSPHEKNSPLSDYNPAAGKYTVRHEELLNLVRSVDDNAAYNMRLNCFDVAAHVVALSNALGCELKRVKIYSKYDLETQRLVPVGFTKPTKMTFTVHCVAWSGPVDDNGRVYDASFALPVRPGMLPDDQVFAGVPYGAYQQPVSYLKTVFTNKEEYALEVLPNMEVVIPASMQWPDLGRN